MKKYFILIILIILFPIVSVDALSCYGDNKDKPIQDINNIGNFKCETVEGDTLTFEHNNEDYSKYFKYEIVDNIAIISIKEKTIKFSSDLKIGIIFINDGTNKIPIYINNDAYIEPTTTTTTVNPNEVTYTVTLEQNDGSEKTTKNCTVSKAGEICNITLPKIEKEGFKGWGTAPSCKEGNTGSIRVDKDTTYYACYQNNENTNTNNKEIYLKSLEILNANNEEKIDFGVFSIKKYEYEFKVLNEVENLKLNAFADENITVNITGNENLSVGENEVIIELKDENNNTNIYKLKVTRLNEGEIINNIHYLKSLVIGGYQIDFNKETLNYSITIPSDINKLVINYIPEKASDTIEVIGNEDLENGSSIKIKVIGEDKLETTYTINIIKESNNMWLLLAIGLIFILIIILIILIIIKNKKNKKPKNNIKPETVKQETIETL